MAVLVRISGIDSLIIEFKKLQHVRGTYMDNQLAYKNSNKLRGIVREVVWADGLGEVAVLGYEARQTDKQMDRKTDR